MLNKDILLEQDSRNYCNCRIPGIVISSSGSIFTYYEARKEWSDWAPIDIIVLRSCDDGKSWQEVHKIFGNGNTMNNPVMIAKDDTLHLLYCENYCRMFYTFSTDDGNSWSEAVEITSVFKNAGIDFTIIAPGPGHGIVSPDGTLLAPVWFAINKEDAHSHRPSFIGTMYSKDNGKSWCAGELIESENLRDPSECALGILNDGSIIISIRNDNDCFERCHAVSKNGYSDWQNICFDPRFPDPHCMGSLYNDGKTLYFINCADKTARKNLVIKKSSDDFKTFEEIVVTERYGGYSDLCVKDGKILVFYEEIIPIHLQPVIHLHFKEIII